ncbi:hypothetical protein ACVBEQ_21160 [Nakamurella sp. GG22]
MRRTRRLVAAATIRLVAAATIRLVAAATIRLVAAATIRLVAAATMLLTLAMGFAPAAAVAGVAPETAAVAPLTSLTAAPTWIARTVPTAPPTPTATLTVTTVPAVAGLRLKFDSETATTNASGTAAFTAARNQDAHTLTVLDTQREIRDTRYTFSRWAGQRDFSQAFTPTLDNVTTRTRNTITAVFTVERAISPQFVDQQGHAVDPARVSAVTARSSTGATVTVSPTGKTWLESNRVIYRSSVDLQVEELSYSWQSVLVDGSNVIDSGRQSFIPAETTAPTVEGQFHDLTVSAHDALFGFPTGTEVVLTFPDGSVQVAPMADSGTAVFSHIPRGTYQAVVRAGPAIINSEHLRLSRDVTVAVPVISILDLAVLTVALAFIAIGVLLIGRRTLRSKILRPFPGLRASGPRAAKVEST